MDQAQQQDDASPCFPRQPAQQAPLSHADDPSPALIIHFAVPPAVTLSWRVSCDAQLRVYGARVWITRACSPYDHWLQPGETLRVRRGERLWVATDDTQTARIALTSAWPVQPGGVRRWIDWLSTWSGGLALRRVR